MDKRELVIQTSALIARDFGLEIGPAPLSEKELLDLLANEVAYMIEYRLDFLLSMMYRLDIEEDKINFALSPQALTPPNMGLAKLILERQKQRIFTKRKYKQDRPDGMGTEWDF